MLTQLPRLRFFFVQVNYQRRRVCAHQWQRELNIGCSAIAPCLIKQQHECHQLYSICLILCTTHSRERFLRIRALGFPTHSLTSKVFAAMLLITDVLRNLVNDALSVLCHLLKMGFAGLGWVIFSNT